MICPVAVLPPATRLNNASTAKKAFLIVAEKGIPLAGRCCYQRRFDFFAARSGQAAPSSGILKFLASSCRRRPSRPRLSRGRPRHARPRAGYVTVPWTRRAFTHGPPTLRSPRKPRRRPSRPRLSRGRPRHARPPGRIRDCPMDSPSLHARTADASPSPQVSPLQQSQRDRRSVARVARHHRLVASSPTPLVTWDCASASLPLISSSLLPRPAVSNLGQLGARRSAIT
ncbi:hypothetical protein THAOC_01104 [Thalassiosira oceanica]|uniref:Uncharacterized protein n=1 Tax=Thalassiosira oceanica TaxID=159749 RepID=K0TJ18_THAOC|nr:hypothetical protein THAOC_01104 [Thalassiosira oceanica]|eukprot:EJK77084.1 hypothetical protein THAOC_01104 [Thalassiosira oceanica]